MDFVRRLYEMATTQLDRDIRPDYIAGVLDPKLYADPTQVTPERFGRDLARLRFLAQEHGPALAEHEGLHHALALTFRPFAATLTAQGHPQPLTTLGQTLWSSLNERLDQVEPNWASREGNPHFVSDQSDHSQQSGIVRSVVLRAFGRLMADSLVERGVLADGPGAPRVDLGKFPGGMIGSPLEAKALLEKCESRAEFTGTWAAMTRPSQLAHLTHGGLMAVLPRLEARQPGSTMKDQPPSAPVAAQPAASPAQAPAVRRKP